jgi:lipopolysaccharide/colanic/teichoic acid biosynthesis glycosyltransferase
MAYSQDTICLFIDHLEPGAKSRWMLNWINTVATSGYKVQVVLLKERHDMRTLLRPAIRYQTLPPWSLFGVIQRMQLIRKLRKQNFRYLHFSGAYSGFYGFLFRFFKANFFLHELEMHQNHWPKRLLQRIDRRLHPHATEALAVIHYPILQWPSWRVSKVHSGTFYLMSYTCFETHLFQEQWLPELKKSPHIQLVVIGAPEARKQSNLILVPPTWDLVSWIQQAEGLLYMREVHVFSSLVFEAVIEEIPVFGPAVGSTDFSHLVTSVDVNLFFSGKPTERAQTLLARKEFVQETFHPHKTMATIDTVHGVERDEKSFMIRPEGAMNYPPPTKFYLFTKRLFDIVLALMLVPLTVLVGILWIIPGKISCGGWFFKQERIGKDEKPFMIYKFQTMWRGFYVPTLAKWMRKLSLDELPQVFNILKGQMSFIGPRPLLPHYLPLYSENQRRRHEVRPGITGLSQVKGRNCRIWQDRLVWDVEYVEARCWKLDIKIIFGTFYHLLFASGEELAIPEFRGNN